VPQLDRFYIGGRWVAPRSRETIDVVDPATEQVHARVATGSAEDIDDAVRAARTAFPAWSRTSREERLALLQRIIEVYRSRAEEIAQTISHEMGAPISLARTVQHPLGLYIFEAAVEVLKTFAFERPQGGTIVRKEPIGVAGLITPWNWPMNQIALKLAPALAVGCTVVLKPSEITPVSALLLAEIIHEAGLPAGVFNLVNGLGHVTGKALSVNPDVDVVSFTGSTRAGVEIARDSAPTIKRVTQELGGKSANILFEGIDRRKTIEAGVKHVFRNSGQTCGAPTRMLIPRGWRDEAHAIAAEVARATKVGDPADAGTEVGPVANARQYAHVQRLIQSGISDGATLVAGGAGKPEGLNQGYYIRPTVFGDVNPDSAIAQEEIFGPVLSIIPYDSEDHAIAIANNSQYGLVAQVHTPDARQARRVATQLRTGQVLVNSPGWDRYAPFGGYKRSGNGREGGAAGFEEYLETKALLGLQAAE
jgi:aldehyde dehydrogenase (NAD+)